MWSSQLLSQFKQLQILAKKFFRASIRFRPMASALALQCSTDCAMETHMLGADQFIKFIFTFGGNEAWIELDLNCRNTDETEMWSLQM